jgi:virginiamycin B lyase
MTSTICRAAERKTLGRAVMAFLLLCAATTASQAASDRQGVAGPAAPRTKTYVYWTNNINGSIGRATTRAKMVNESFITLNTTGGAGLTVDSNYIYWTSANGGTATTIGRANLDGTGVNANFITGAENPCGVAVDSSYVYWAGDVGSSIGRANLDGSGVNQDFVTTGTGVCGVAVTSSYIFWANYRNSEIGRANIDGSGANNSFISGCGSGIAIEGNHIYFTTAAGNAIGRANLDGTGVNLAFITGLNGGIAFLAANSRYLYWADWDSNAGTTIGRARLNGTDVNQSFITGTDGGFGIAVTGGDP